MKLVERVKSAIKHRNNFSLTYEGVLTADFGDFVPILCKEVVPTDSFTIQSQAFFRLSPLAVPTFGKIHGYINTFFVPIRILMPENEYEDSMTGGVNGDYPETFPFITYAAIKLLYNTLKESFHDDQADKRFRKLFSYLGLGNLPQEIEDSLTNDHVDFSKLDDEEHSISLLPFIALFRIFYDYYAPLNLEEDEGLREIFTRKYKGLITAGTTDPDAFIDWNNRDMSCLALAFALLATCYNKDYYTMAMTRPQRGAASVVPVDSLANGRITGNFDAQFTSSGGHTTVDSVSDSSASGKAIISNFEAIASSSEIKFNQIKPSAVDEKLDLNNFTSSAHATGRVNISDVGGLGGRFRVQTARLAERIQAFLERNNIAGGRFFEQMAARFGVKMSSAVLQRSEYLGGNDFWINISDVTSTASTSDASLGEYAGKGIGLGKRNCVFSADDFGFVISLLHFVPETFGLVDGLDRMFTRHSKFDYWQPEIEDTGMQPVYNKELNRRLTWLKEGYGSVNPDGVFGYNPRFAEYKTANPILAGDFVLNSEAERQNLLDSYHLFRRIKGSEAPILNREFVSILGFGAGQNNFSRIFQNTSPDFDHFIINTQVSIGANRPMIGYAEAGLEFTHEESGNSSVTLPYGGERK